MDLTKLRKEYVLVSSDARNAGSASTTDFTVSLSRPIENVVRTDIVQVIMDYKVANIVAPANAFDVGEGYLPASDVIKTVSIAADLWQMSDLLGTLQMGLNVGGFNYTIDYLSNFPNLSSEMDATFRLAIQQDVTDIPFVDAADRVMTLSSALADALGATSLTITPSEYSVTIDSTERTFYQWIFSAYASDVDVTFESAQTLTVYVSEGTSQPVTTTFTIDEGLYTPSSLEDALVGLMTDYVVQVSNAGVLSIEYALPNASDSSGNRLITVTSAALRSKLGMTTTTLTPSWEPLNGPHGTLRWVFPRALLLTQTATYLLLQSRELGNDIITATGDVAFYRLLLADPVNGVVSATNNRVDTYLHAPRRLKDIDLRVLFPDKSVVNNRGGSLTLLLEVVRSI